MAAEGAPTKKRLGDQGEVTEIRHSDIGCWDCYTSLMHALLPMHGDLKLLDILRRVEEVYGKVNTGHLKDLVIGRDPRDFLCEKCQPRTTRMSFWDYQASRLKLEKSPWISTSDVWTKTDYQPE
jgi:hypothetical protein